MAEQHHAGVDGITNQLGRVAIRRPSTMPLMSQPEMQAIGLNYMGESWVAAMQEEFHKPYFKEIARIVYERRRNDPLAVSPRQEKVFNWTRHCNIYGTRVVILGQDPYCNPRLAQGLAFSVENFQSMPNRSFSSLANISKAVAYSERRIPINSQQFRLPLHGDLTPWAKQGVVLLNSSLTVDTVSNSHRDIGWKTFTDRVIREISDRCENVAFMLWGNEAKEKRSLIDQRRHLVLETSHPSPRSADKGFLRCHHFAIANQYLLSKGNGPAIDWCGAFWPDGP